MKLILRSITAILFIACFTQSSIAQKVQLNHIAVYVADLEESTNFYSNIIGLDTIPEPFHDGKHTWYNVGRGYHLHLISGNEKLRDVQKHNHLCLSVSSVPDFIKVLEKNNIVYEDWAGTKNSVTNRVDGVHQIYFKDPNGYWLEINDARD